MSDPFGTVQTELPRDRWGRPLITPPDGGETVAYQRVTTFVGALEDTYHLGEWGKRTVALGMAKRRDLQIAAAAITDPKDQYQKRTLNKIAKDALEAAGGGAAATTGTALHSITETIDAGIEPSYIPEEFEADIASYREVIAPFVFIDSEGFCVRDDLRVGGSYDRLFALRDQSKPLIAPDGEEVVGGVWDLKTGGSDGTLFGIGKIAMQLGTYRNSVKYDHTLGSRSPLPGDDYMSRKWGIVCHLPAGGGKAQLLWIDIGDGWDIAYNVAPLVHAWCKRKDLSFPLASAEFKPRSVTLVELITSAPSYATLQRLYADNAHVWTPGLTQLAADRRAELEKS